MRLRHLRAAIALTHDDATVSADRKCQVSDRHGMDETQKRAERPKSHFGFASEESSKDSEDVHVGNSLTSGNWRGRDLVESRVAQFRHGFYEWRDVSKQRRARLATATCC
ncbi:hypothetical protein Y032_0406g897 [Ancylostoma ceylanicum]|uniref:Uncharacterized protein n=1 Tax=Ancylostoma ceylanicum TaxID=53326 RepID=A0A016X3N5_9BILA|nr:hypothetical protein Y032_0406g897 [Ancylostoma ceylanicum]